MKKKVAVLAMCLMTFVGSTCLAQISRSDVAVGGLTPSCSMDYVRGIYGEPDRSTNNLPSKMPLYTYYYGDSLEIVSLGGNRATIIKTTANNGLETPAGIHVGMDASIIEQTYGAYTSKHSRDGVTYLEYNPDRSGMTFLIFGVKKIRSCLLAREMIGKRS